MSRLVAIAFLTGGTVGGGVFGIEKLTNMTQEVETLNMSTSVYKHKFGGIYAYHFLDTSDTKNDWFWRIRTTEIGNTSSLVEGSFFVTVKEKALSSDENEKYHAYFELKRVCEERYRSDDDSHKKGETYKWTEVWNFCSLNGIRIYIDLDLVTELKKKDYTGKFAADHLDSLIYPWVPLNGWIWQEKADLLSKEETKLVDGSFFTDAKSKTSDEEMINAIKKTCDSKYEEDKPNNMDEKWNEVIKFCGIEVEKEEKEDPKQKD
ncbi:hypothetical protein MHSWG343_10170 [Candidatus Mycoplasma haematohominis]|uniref:Uncharacterized protein n=1 Tax=Candidatus Mycoplasma haematohominis TaxID=1494318 RepID=A0A478FU93_9MOLU|nr:hypothetical protein MHSWG343_10170 [Candidatus Mycoplasma haemohominis]